MSSARFPTEFYKDMVVNRYFGKVDRKDLGGVLRTFTPGAGFTIQSAFTTHEGRDTGIKKMFENLFENYQVIVHRDFVHVVDVENNACAAQFNVELTDPDGNFTKLSNCNFFYLDDAGKFKRVFVYMSGPNVLV
ncbi:MAG TPA: nuclear transport factor 2 family protein [Bryobacteraceae bacterium]|nr:nuclear transport factor 2 family protein [Bryobacteraceae bacterium]